MPNMTFTKKGVARPVIVPKYNILPPFIISNILRTGNISRDKYIELLTGKSN